MIQKGNTRSAYAAVDTTDHVIHFCITMPSTASLRDLRNAFPKVRRLLETEGEVLLTEKGRPRYRLTAYEPPAPAAAPRVDYWKRLTASQPKTLSAAQVRALHDENRGDR